MSADASLRSRRRFLRDAVAVTAAPLSAAVSAALAGCADINAGGWPSRVLATPQDDGSHASGPTRRDHYGRLLILVELKGGNDGLNTLVPYADPAYYALRPRLALARDSVLQLTDRDGLHPALRPLLAFWNDRSLAILRGVGYPAPNLSHFRSIEIWDTASRSDQVLTTGWLTRTFAETPTPRGFAADGFVIGGYDLGPLDGGARALTLVDTMQFQRKVPPAPGITPGSTPALAHLLRTEANIVQASAQLAPGPSLGTEFPPGAFGNAVRTACNVIARAKGVAVIRLTLNGFDTHANQASTQARLLGEFADGIVALAHGLQELGRWNDALVLTYAEFGRRPHENLSGGTDHGTSNVHFALGGRVAGDLYGAQPVLASLSPGANPAHAIDFRSVYATALEHWWGIGSRDVLGGRFDPLPILRA